MRVLHFFKTYLPETVGGIEQVIYQLCQSTGAHGVENEVLTLSADPRPAQLTVGNHRVHRAKLDLQLASTGFSYSALGRLKALAAQADFVSIGDPGRDPRTHGGWAIRARHAEGPRLFGPAQ